MILRERNLYLWRISQRPPTVKFFPPKDLTLETTKNLSPSLENYDVPKKKDGWFYEIYVVL